MKVCMCVCTYYTKLCECVKCVCNVLARSVCATLGSGGCRYILGVSESGGGTAGPRHGALPRLVLRESLKTATSEEHTGVPVATTRFH